MKKKIIILGSTGSIGKSTLDVIKKNKKNFDIYLLSASNNYRDLIKQAKTFKARNVLIRNKIFFKQVQDGLKKYPTKVYSGDISLSKIISKKMDYAMCAIVGIAGLQPTLDSIKISIKRREFLWNEMIKLINFDILTEYSKVISLEELLNIYPKILKGEIAGRILVDLKK